MVEICKVAEIRKNEFKLVDVSFAVQCIFIHVESSSSNSYKVLNRIPTEIKNISENILSGSKSYTLNFKIGVIKILSFNCIATMKLDVSITYFTNFM